jgi:hypothetical protein
MKVQAQVNRTKKSYRFTQRLVEAIGYEEIAVAPAWFFGT